MALTGESEGVKKDATFLVPADDAAVSDEKTENPDQKEKSLTSSNMVYMGCSVLDGRGLGIVCQ
jgi:magnesium-transporting ATPase (P-type)